MRRAPGRGAGGGAGGPALVRGPAPSRRRARRSARTSPRAPAAPVLATRGQERPGPRRATKLAPRTRATGSVPAPAWAEGRAWRGVLASGDVPKPGSGSGEKPGGGAGAGHGKGKDPGTGHGKKGSGVGDGKGESTGTRGTAPSGPAGRRPTTRAPATAAPGTATGGTVDPKLTAGVPAPPGTTPCVGDPDGTHGGSADPRSPGGAPDGKRAGDGTASGGHSATALDKITRVAGYANLELNVDREKGQSGGIPGGHGSHNMGAIGQIAYVLLAIIGIVGPGKVVKSLRLPGARFVRLAHGRSREKVSSSVLAPWFGTGPGLVRAPQGQSVGRSAGACSAEAALAWHEGPRPAKQSPSGGASTRVMPSLRSSSLGHGRSTDIDHGWEVLAASLDRTSSTTWAPEGEVELPVHVLDD